MSDSYDANVDKWLDSLTDPQTRALGHQVGIAGSVTYPIEKIRSALKHLKNFRRVKRIYEEHYGSA